MSAEVEVYKLPGDVPAIVAFYPGEKKIEAASREATIETARLLGRPNLANIGTDVQDNGLIATCKSDHVPYGSRPLSNEEAFNAMRKIEALRAIARDGNRQKVLKK